MTAARKLVDPYLEQQEEPVQIPVSRRKRKRSRIPITVKVCFLAFFCVVLALVYLHQQVTSYYLSMELSQLKQEVNVLEQRNEHLMLELESQRSLRKIEEIARKELGMVEPERLATLVIDQKQPGESPQGAWLVTKMDQKSEGLFATLAAWLNKAFPLGGVEAGTL